MGKYFPIIDNPKVTLGTMDKNGNIPQDPVITIGPTSKQGTDLPSGKKHSDYIDKYGYHDIVNKMLEDHQE